MSLACKPLLDLEASRLSALEDTSTVNAQRIRAVLEVVGTASDLGHPLYPPNCPDPGMKGSHRSVPLPRSDRVV